MWQARERSKQEDGNYIFICFGYKIRECWLTGLIRTKKANYLLGIVRSLLCFFDFYTTPWAIMASATLMKPAIFDPTTRFPG